MQPDFCASSALAWATPAALIPTAASTANINDFIESPLSDLAAVRHRFETGSSGPQAV
jgi:hypothetical protein